MEQYKETTNQILNILDKETPSVKELYYLAKYTYPLVVLYRAMILFDDPTPPINPDERIPGIPRRVSFFWIHFENEIKKSLDMVLRDQERDDSKKNTIHMTNMVKALSVLCHVRLNDPNYTAPHLDAIEEVQPNLRFK